MRCFGSARALAVATAVLLATGCGGGAHAGTPEWTGEIVVSQNHAGGSALYVLHPGSPARRVAVGVTGSLSSPSLTGGGRTVVFARTAGGTSRIWTAAIDGTGARPLTGGPGRDELPAVSPDGRMIAFVSTRSGSAQVWVMRRDGAGARRLTGDLGAEERVSWSPGGGRIAYSCLAAGAGRGDDSDNTDICTISAAGADERRLTPDPMRRDSQPAWSPSGGWIVFVRDRGALMEVHPDGSALRLVRPAGASGWAYPVWSPDGRRLLVLDRAGLRLRVGAPAGGVLRAIAHTELTAAPAWFDVPS